MTPTGTDIALLSPAGDTILETMEYIGISKETLAAALQLSVEATNTLLKGELKIDLVLADRLEAIFNIPANFWITREANFRHELEMIGK